MTSNEEIKFYEPFKGQQRFLMKIKQLEKRNAELLAALRVVEAETKDRFIAKLVNAAIKKAERSK